MRGLSVKKFERRHPDCQLDIQRENGWVTVTATWHRVAIASVSRDQAQALSDLSAKLLKLKGRILAQEAGWSDANTGERGVPLSMHHRQKRSHGRLDAESNLVPVGQRTHAFQHEGRTHGKS
jgi:hypothetical protein